MRTNPSTSLRLKVQAIVMLTEACLLTLWLANGEQWAKALFLSWAWTTEIAFLLSMGILHLSEAAGLPRLPQPRDDRPQWFRHASLGWNISAGCLLITVAGHPALGCLVILTIGLKRVDDHFRSKA